MQISVESKSVDKRKVRHDRKRQKLLDEAMALVVEDGMEGLTIARLANRIGGSVGALYRYFESKEELVVGLQEMAIADFRGFLDQRLSTQDAALAAGTAPRVAALTRIMAAVQAYVDHADASPQPHRLVDLFLSMPDAVLSDEDAKAVGQRVVAPILEIVGGLLAQAVGVGALQPGHVEQRTHLAWAFVHGLDHFRKRDRLNGEHLQVQILLPLAMRTLLGGFGAQAADLDAAEKLVVD